MQARRGRIEPDVGRDALLAQHVLKAVGRVVDQATPRELVEQTDGYQHLNYTAPGRSASAGPSGNTWITIRMKLDASARTGRASRHGHWRKGAEMLTRGRLLAAAGLFLAAATASRCTSAPPPPAAAQPDLSPAVSILELMTHIVDPIAD